MRAPEKSEVLGLTYRVVVAPTRNFVGEDKVDGYEDTKAQVIYACSEQPNQQIADTVIHEHIHAVERSLGMDLDEKDVVRWATIIRNLIGSNPDTFVWLAEMMSGKKYRKA